MSSNGERGSGRLGFIIMLAIFLSACYAGFKIIPVRVSAYELRDTIRQEARVGAVRASDDVVAKRILDKASELDLPLKKKDVEVRRTKGEIIVKARYEQPIDLKVTTYIYKFEAEERAPLF